MNELREYFHTVFGGDSESDAQSLISYTVTEKGWDATWCSLCARSVARVPLRGVWGCQGGQWHNHCTGPVAVARVFRSTRFAPLALRAVGGASSPVGHGAAMDGKVGCVLRLPCESWIHAIHACAPLGMNWPQQSPTRCGTAGASDTSACKRPRAQRIERGDRATRDSAECTGVPCTACCLHAYQQRPPRSHLPSHTAMAGRTDTLPSLQWLHLLPSPPLTLRQAPRM